MFSYTQPTSNMQSLKCKQSIFKKQTTHASKQNTLQSLRYLTFSQLIDWRLPLPAFQGKVSTIFNYYTILNTLFAVSQQMDWRLYIPHMNVLISTFHNIMCGKRGSGLQDVGKIQGLEVKLERLFLLKDITLHGHLMMLVKMLLAYNPKYAFMKETTFSRILIESATYNDLSTLTQVIWILSQIQVSSQAFIKLINHSSLNSTLNNNICLLPLLTIVANFLSDPNQNPTIVQHLITSPIFQRIFQMGLSSDQIEIINETILMFNNGVCFSEQIRNMLLENSNMVGLVMSFDCPERDRLREIMGVLQYQREGGYGQQQQNDNMMGIDYSI